MLLERNLFIAINDHNSDNEIKIILQQTINQQDSPEIYSKCKVVTRKILLS